MEELLQNALSRNAAHLAAAQEEEEANFYSRVRPVLQDLLKTVQFSPGKMSLSEYQLIMLKGVLSSSFVDFRAAYQKAREFKAQTLEELRQQWAIRERLSTKLDVPFTSDTSFDAEEEPLDDERD